MKLTAAVSAAFLSVMMLSPAGAAPAKTGITLEPLTSEVQMRKRYRGDTRRHYRAGRHYGRAPRGWHRYQSRPRGWRNRGCIVVGPLWFCP